MSPFSRCAATRLSRTRLTEHWRICLGNGRSRNTNPPKQMDGDQQRPLQLQIDKHKAALFQALLGLDAKHVSKNKFLEEAR